MVVRRLWCPRRDSAGTTAFSALIGRNPCPESGDCPIYL